MFFTPWRTPDCIYRPFSSLEEAPKKGAVRPQRVLESTEGAIQLRRPWEDVITSLSPCFQKYTGQKRGSGGSKPARSNLHPPLTEGKVFTQFGIIYVTVRKSQKGKYSQTPPFNRNGGSQETRNLPFGLVHLLPSLARNLFRDAPVGV